MKLFTIDSMCENEITYTASNHNAFELFNSILNQEDENKEYCLISNEPLNETRITLPCGHCFNYLLYDLIITRRLIIIIIIIVLIAEKLYMVLYHIDMIYQKYIAKI